MATIGNRQNLTDAEAALYTPLFTAAGRIDSVRTNAANNTIFAGSNTVVGDTAATATKQRAARDKIVSDNK